MYVGKRGKYISQSCVVPSYCGRNPVLVVDADVQADLNDLTDE